MIWILISTAIVIFITNVLGTITGFGVVVMAFPFITVLLGIYEAKVLLGIVGWSLGLYILGKNFRDIHFPQFGRIVLGTVSGMPIGIWFFSQLPADTLKLILGAFIVIVSVIQLRLEFRNKPLTRKVPGWAYGLLLFFAGIVHGAFGISGPFIVLYAARYIPERHQFRSTLSLVWVTVNTVLFMTDPTFYPFFSHLSGYLFGSEPVTGDVAHLFFIIPFIAAGFFVGERLLDRVDTRIFRRLIFSVLLATGAIMMGGAIF